MASDRPNKGKRKLSPGRQTLDDGRDKRIQQLMRQRAFNERRLREKHDMRMSKGKSTVVSPDPVPGPVPLRKYQYITTDSSSPKRVPPPRIPLLDVKKESDTESGSDDNRSSDFGSDVSTDKDWSLKHSRKHRGGNDDKKPIKIGPDGFPYGNMREVLADDIKRYAKDLDPTTSWEGQPGGERRRFFRRLYSNWTMKGKGSGVSEKWVSPIITKILINSRWRLNCLIDNCKPKPPEVTEEQWNTLVRNRASPASRKMSEHMRAISVGKGSKALQLRCIEKDAIVKLSIQHKRAPFDCEITDEVAREYRRQEEQRQDDPVLQGTYTTGMTSRVNLIEGSMTRLEGKMDFQHSRLEELLRNMIGNPAESSRASAERLASTVQRAAAEAHEGTERSFGAQVQSAAATNVTTVGNLTDGIFESVPMEERDDMNIEGVTEGVHDVVAAVGVVQNPVEGDAYDIDHVSLTQGPTPKPVEEPEQEEEVDGSVDLPTRGRRLLKNIQPPSGTRCAGPAKTMKQTPVRNSSVPIVAQAVLKVTNSKKTENARKK